MEEERVSDVFYPGEERRQFKRFPFVFPVKYTYLGKDPKNPNPSEFSLYSFSNNISRGGLMLTLSNNVPVGEYIGLVMTLPIEHDVIIIEASGLVKWIQKEEEGYLVGIEFSDINENDLATIQKMLETDNF
jgi:c-di-GMP-binding flagellar brake protein YcgR